MTRAERRALWLASVLTALSAAIWAVESYAAGDDPFAPARERATLALDVHLLGAPVLVFVLGWIFPTHLLPRLAGRAESRASGWALFATCAMMLASGVVLPVAPLELHALLGWVHGLTGAAYALLFAWHALSARSSARATS